MIDTTDLVYDKGSGKLYWKNPVPGIRNKELEAGTETHGYIRVSLKNKRYAAHRIVWEMNNGKIPCGMEIDHIDGNRSNNRLSNLRLVSSSQNMRNKSVQKNSSTRVLGVNEHSGGYKVTVFGKYIGWKRDFFEACCLRKSHELRNEFHENHGRKKND